MPEMTGVELLSLVARLHPRVMRAVLTGQVDAQLVISAINAGHVHRFMLKPWDDDTLRDAVIALVREAERRAGEAMMRAIGEAADAVAA
jgi:FixJ family two-component response regulator